MTTKLTLTIEEEVIQSAKKYATRKGTSISAVVENYLKAISGKSEDRKQVYSPRIRKLLGAAKPTKTGDYKLELSRALSKKYR